MKIWHVVVQYNGKERHLYFESDTLIVSSQVKSFLHEQCISYDEFEIKTLPLLIDKLRKP